MRNVRTKLSFVIIVLCALTAGLVLAGQEPQRTEPAAAPPAAIPLAQIVERAIGREATLVQRLRGMQPIVETYLQNLDKDDDLAFSPAGDRYFLGRLDFRIEMREKSLLEKPGWAKSFTDKIAQLYSVKYLPEGFAQMLVVHGSFDKASYNFEYVRREFLGEVRTIVLDVTPKKGSKAIFKGRIWIEDEDYNVVRFNGTYGPSTATKMYFHFDSWREQMGPGLWLPAYVYTEESDMSYLFKTRKLRFKGQTRLWGYNVAKSNAQNELTALIVESDSVRDNVDESEGMSPVRALRAWERQAEDNVIQRLEKAAILAPDGEVNKVLETVITNLEVTNNLDITPEVRARVILTSPLESFTTPCTVPL